LCRQPPFEQRGITDPAALDVDMKNILAPVLNF
jgi:hypothetical protein